MANTGDVSRPTHRSLNWVWSVSLLNWVVETQPGGSGGAITNDGTFATPAKQDTGNASLASIDGKLTNPLPVSLASVPSHAVTNAGTFAVQVTSAPTTAVTNAGLTNLDVALSTRTKPADQQHTIIDSGTVTAVTAITNALPAGANVIGHVIADSGSTTAVTGNVTVVQPTGTNLHVVVDTAPTTAVTGTFFQATQPVSIAASVAVTGTFFQATQPVSLASVPPHDVTNAGVFAVQVTSAPTTAVTGPLTDTQLRATAVPVSGTLTANSTALVTANNPLLAEGATQQLSVDNQGYLRTKNDLLSSPVTDLLVEIVAELRVQNALLHTTLNSRDDLERLRYDAQQIQRGFTIN